MSTCFFSKIVYKMDKIIVRQDNLGKKNGKRMVGLSYNHQLTGFLRSPPPHPIRVGESSPPPMWGIRWATAQRWGGAWLCRFFQLPHRTDNLNHDLGSDFDGIFLRNLKKVGGVVGNARQKHKQLVLPQRHAALGRWQYRAFAQEE